MLVLSRKKGESVVVNGNIKIVVVDVRGDKARLGIEAPADVAVYRSEALAKIAAAQGNGRENPAAGEPSEEKFSDKERRKTFEKLENVATSKKRPENDGVGRTGSAKGASAIENRQNSENSENGEAGKSRGSAKIGKAGKTEKKGRSLGADVAVETLYLTKANEAYRRGVAENWPETPTSDSSDVDDEKTNAPQPTNAFDASDRPEKAAEANPLAPSNAENSANEENEVR